MIKKNFKVEESLDAKENIFKNHLEEEIIHQGKTGTIDKVDHESEIPL